MSEETKQQETTTTTDQKTGEATISNADIRNSELFRKVTSEQQSKLEAAIAELATLKASITDEKEAARVKRLEEEGNYKQLIDEKNKEIQSIQSRHETQLRRLALKDEFRKHKINDEYFLEHHLNRFEGNAEEIENYVKDLMENEITAKYFGEIEIGSKGQPSPRGVTPGTRSTEKTLDERMLSDDPLVREQARREKWASIMGD